LNFATLYSVCGTWGGVLWPSHSTVPASATAFLSSELYTIDGCDFLAGLWEG
jgi:hypothetical protein